MGTSLVKKWGFMMAAAFLSMCLANIIIVLLMLPIAIAIIEKEELISKRSVQNGRVII